MIDQEMRNSGPPLCPETTELLMDGSSVVIRAMRPGDAKLEEAFINRLSSASKHFRFRGQVRCPNAALIEQLCNIDLKRDLALIALAKIHGELTEVGVSRFSSTTDGDACECAVTVADDWQRRGLGVILMRRLIEMARARGMKTMFSIDANDNYAMQDLAKFLGFSRVTDRDDVTQVRHELKL